MEEKFKPNTTVYAYHGPLMYEAKILKIHEQHKQFIENNEGKHEPLEESKLPENMLDVNTYYLHYQGWNSKWDEWVTVERLLEYNEENKRAKKELDELSKRKKSAKKGTTGKNTLTNSTATNNNSKAATNGKKRSLNDKLLSKRKKENSKPEITIQFKPELKYILIDDWEFITKDKQLISVPSKNPVSKILKDYYNFRKKTIANEAILNEILNGLELYFNKSLSLILLYKFERLQYLNLIREGVTKTKKLSEIYGLEHLLRLFTALPGLISQTSMDPISIGVLVQESQDILDFLQKNLHKYTNEYINTSPAYDSLARS